MRTARNGRILAEPSRQILFGSADESPVVYGHVLPPTSTVVLVTAALWVAALLAPVTAIAQSTTATILGTVTDSSDAVLPGVAVTIVNEGTNSQRTVTTHCTGGYEAPLLPPAPYRVEGELTGFKKIIRSASRCRSTRGRGPESGRFPAGPAGTQIYVLTPPLPNSGLTNGSAAALFVTRIAAASHSTGCPVRSATFPSSSDSVSTAAYSKGDWVFACPRQASSHSW